MPIILKTLTPDPADTQEVTLRKILQRLNGTVQPNDNGSTLLAKILRQLNSASDSLEAEEVFNVRNYGAVLDGVTDDSAALDSAVAAARANGGGTVLIPGTLGVGSLGWVGINYDGLTNVEFLGASPGNGFRFLHEPNQYLQSLGCSILMENCTRVTFRNLKFDGTYCAGNGPGTAIAWDSCGECAVRDCEITKTKTGIWSIRGTNLTILRNYIHDLTIAAARGMWIGNTNIGTHETRPLIAENIVEDTAATGIGGTIQEGLILNNRVKDVGGSGVAIGSANNEYYKVTVIQGNICQGCAFHGIQSDTTGAYYNHSINVVGNLCFNNNQSGIYAVNCENWNIVGNICFNNSQDSASSAGITISDHARAINVSGNLCYDDQGTKTQYYGIYVVNDTNGATCKDINVVNNVLRGSEGFNFLVTIAGGGTVNNINVSGNTCDGESVTPYGLGFASSGITGTFSNNVCHDHTSYDFGNGAVAFPDGSVGGNNLIAGSDKGRLPMSGMDGKHIWWGTAAPAANTWKRGDVCFNYNAATGQPIGWVCTVAGTPGTWVAMANL